MQKESFMIGRMQNGELTCYKKLKKDENVHYTPTVGVSMMYVTHMAFIYYLGKTIIFMIIT